MCRQRVSSALGLSLVCERLSACYEDEKALYHGYYYALGLGDSYVDAHHVAGRHR